MLSKSGSFPLRAILLLLFISTGCASTYKPVDLARLNYGDPRTVSDSLRVSYFFDVQEATGNRRYARKEQKRGLSAVAVKIDNITTTPLVVNRTNFMVYSGTNEVSVLPPMAYSSKVKQRVGLHLLHALWGPWGIRWSEDASGERDVSGYYIPVGLIVGIGNAVRASNANKKNMANMEANEIWGRQILPGQTLFGLIAIPSNQKESLNFSFGSTGADSIPSAHPMPAFVPKYNVKSLVYDFYVMSENGNAYDIKSKIHTTEARHYILNPDRTNGVSKIYPSDTKTLSRITESGKQLLGIPHGDQWLFRIIEGRINGYFFLAEETSDVVSYIQKGSDPMTAFTPQALMTMVERDPVALELIRKGKYVEAIKKFNSSYK